MISYIILILVIIYIIRYSTTLDTIKPNVTNLHKNSLISIGIVPIFSKKNSSYHEFFKIIKYLNHISKSKNIFKRNKISIKIPQLSPNKHLQWIYLLNIVSFAKEYNIFVWISTIIPSTLDQEYNFYLELLSMGYRNIGITLSTFNYSVTNKIDNILKLKGHIRLVKGMYYGNITNKDIINKIYYNNAIKLVNSGYYHTLATHDFTILEKLYYHNNKYTDFIELAFFHSSYNYVKYMLPKMPFNTEYISFYIWYGNYFQYIKDNILLYSFDTIFYSISSTFNSLKYAIKQ